MKKVFLICMLAINITSYAQTGVAVNTTGAAANSNAMLDVSATNKGMLVPRVDLVALTGNVVTSFGISATPTTSLLVYNTTASVIFQTGFYFWDGSLWTKLNTGATSSVANAWSLTGNASTTASNYIGTTDALPLSLRTAGLDRLNITSAGNVGIGTTAPLRKLHIVSGAEALRIEGTNNWIGFAESALGTYNGYLYQTASNFILGTISGSTKNIQLSPKGIPALTALATGEIGIGTTAPQALLEVKGASNPSFTPTLKLVETSASAFSRIHFTNPTGSSEWHIKGRNTTLNTDDRLNFEHTLSGNILTLAGDGATGGVVGINTEGYSGVPKATLDIRGESYTNFPNLLLYDKLGGYSRLQFQNSSGPSHWLIAGLNGTVNSNERLNFYNSTSGDALSITGDGKIGIGTTTPAEKLTVITAANSNGITHTDGTIKLTTYVGGATNGAYFGTPTNHPLSFYTNNSPAQVTLLQNGNFGIGTNNPGEKLVVNTALNKVGLAHTNGDIQITTYLSNDTDFGGQIGTTSQHPLRFFAGNNYAEATLLPNGNFGIGTLNPSHKLSVNGTMRSKEVIVETGWADFVFDKNYKLPSLFELEKYINENNHLPNIPSAEEIQTNGLKVGEVQTKMMQKIEELTLYVIELKKEIEILKAKK